MRVCIVAIAAGSKKGIETAARAMAREIEASGHAVELLTGERGEGPRLAMSDYVIMGTEPVGFSGKLPSRVADFLAQGTGLKGKRSMAFVLKRGPFRNKTLPRLMKAMEAEGMNVNFDEVVGSSEEAARAAKAAPIERHV